MFTVDLTTCPKTLIVEHEYKTKSKLKVIFTLDNCNGPYRVNGG